MSGKPGLDNRHGSPIDMVERRPADNRDVPQPDWNTDRDRSEVPLRLTTAPAIRFVPGSRLFANREPSVLTSRPANVNGGCSRSMRWEGTRLSGE